MKLPDENGRAAILRYYLKPLKLDPGIDVDTLVSELAASADGASGADLEYLCQTTARICVKEAVSHSAQPDVVTISATNFETALAALGYAAISPVPENGRLAKAGRAACNTFAAKHLPS